MRNCAENFVVFGAGGVGKSALMVRMTADYFLEDPELREGEPWAKQVRIDGEVSVINILETQLDPSYGSMNDHYMRSGKGFVLVYSIVSRSSFEQVRGLYHRIHEVRTPLMPPPAIVIVGNKCDLGDDMRAVSTKEGTELAQSLGCAFLETSAKTRINVEETYIELVRQVRRTTRGDDAGDERKTKKKWNPSASTSNDRCIVS